MNRRRAAWRPRSLALARLRGGFRIEINLHLARPEAKLRKLLNEPADVPLVVKRDEARVKLFRQAGSREEG